MGSFSPPPWRISKTSRLANGLKWGVLVIDNASTDRTALLARQVWSADGPAPLRVVCEPRLGLSYARKRAFDEAQYGIVSFIDDDNWINPEWVRIVVECMSADREAGAIGSVNIAVADVPFPDWYSRYCHCYAAWAYYEHATPPAPWFLTGAGMTIRKSVWHGFRRNRFRSQLTGRLGARLTGCEDLEIGSAIHLAGWKIEIEPRLRLQHYMSPGRLNWGYLRKLRRATGEGWVVLEAYLAPVRSEGLTLRDYLSRCWWLRAAKGGLELLRAYSLITLVQCLFRDMEGDDEVIAVEFDIGWLIGFFQLRSRYSQVWWNIALAPWRRRNSLHQNLAVIAVPGCLLPDRDSAPVNDHSRIRPRRCETL